MKPRIKRFRGRWKCSSYAFVGYGATPLAAWQAWRLQRNFWLNR